MSTNKLPHGLQQAVNQLGNDCMDSSAAIEAIHAAHAGHVAALARIAELEAERDELRAKYDELLVALHGICRALGLAEGDRSPYSVTCGVLERVNRLAEIEAQEPVAKIHADGYWTAQRGDDPLSDGRAFLSVYARPVPAQAHRDDQAVDNFACAMRRKLALARAKGRGGWDDPAQCGVETLARMLVEHVRKGDPVDVANFAMMLHQRGAGTAVLAEAAAQAVPDGWVLSAGSRRRDLVKAGALILAEIERMDRAAIAKATGAAQAVPDGERRAVLLTDEQILELEAGCGHARLHWDTRLSIVRAAELAVLAANNLEVRRG